MIRQHTDNINALKAALEKLVFEIAAKYQAQMDLLMTVPGISTPLTAIRILAEIGADVSVFEAAKQLTSWAGRTPQNQESAGKQKTTRIGRAGAHLKTLLVQIALAVGKSEKIPELKNKYLALKNGTVARKPSLPFLKNYSLLFGISSAKMKLTMLNFTGGLTCLRPRTSLLPSKRLLFCAPKPF